MTPTRSLKTMRRFSTRRSSDHFPVISSHGTACGRSKVCDFSGGRCDYFFRPLTDRLIDRVELLGEEVIRARDDHALRVAHLLRELLQLLHVAMLVLRSMEKEDRLLAAAQMAEVVFVDRSADEKHRVDLRQLARDTRRDPGAEREAADNEFLARMFALHPLDCRADVVLLALALLMLARARTDSPEVEPQRGDICVFQTARGAKHDFVVQRSAA